MFGSKINGILQEVECVVPPRDNSLLLDPQTRARMRFSNNGLGEVKALWAVIIPLKRIRELAAKRAVTDEAIRRSPPTTTAPWP